MRKFDPVHTAGAAASSTNYGLSTIGGVGDAWENFVVGSLLDVATETVEGWVRKAEINPLQQQRQSGGGFVL